MQPESKIRFVEPDLVQHHYSTRVFNGYLLYLERKFGRERANEIIEGTGLNWEYLSNSTNWVSEKFADQLYAKLRTLPSIDKDFAYQASSLAFAAEASGPVAVIGSKFLSVRAFLQQFVRFGKKYNQVDYFEIKHISRNSAQITIVSRRATEHLDLIADGWRGSIENGLSFLGKPKVQCQAQLNGGSRITLEVTWQEDALKIATDIVKALSVGLFAVWSVAFVANRLNLISWSLPSEAIWLSLFGSLSATHLVSVVRIRNSQERTDQVERVLSETESSHRELVLHKEKLDRRYREAKLLSEVLQRIGHTRNYDVLIQNTLSEIRHTLKYDRVVS